MKQRSNFGQRGVEAKAVNPYTLQRMPVAGSAQFDVRTGVDENLRAFMLRVYNIMAFGLVITGAVAFLTYTLTVTGDPSLAAQWSDDTLVQITSTEYLNDLGALLWMTPVSYVLCFGPLALVLFTSFLWRGLSASVAMVLFVVLAALVGISFSGLALTYTNGSIAQMFFATATAFGGLSLVGYTTKRDLSGWGAFLWMGLFGVIAAFIFNMIWPSEMMTFVISCVGVIVFAGFTAYDTQMIKQAYSAELTPELRNRLAIRGALDLYLDFINMFRFLLVLFGARE